MGKTGHCDDDDDQMQSPPSISDDGEAEDNGTHLCVIDVGSEEEETEEERESRERKCRICHMGYDKVHTSVGKMVNLGCACKGELGTSHYHCAHAWFFQKGNRTCEICGNPAKNIKGIEDTGFRSVTINSLSLEINRNEENENRCTMSLCNLLLALVILAFFLPWIFRRGKL